MTDEYMAFMGAFLFLAGIAGFILMLVLWEKFCGDR